MWWEIFVLILSFIFLVKLLKNHKSNGKNKHESQHIAYSQKEAKEIPGMKPSHPEEGNSPDMKKAKSVGRFLCDLHKRYGTIASFWNGRERCVSVCDPEQFKKMRHLYNIPDKALVDFKLIIGEDSLFFNKIEEVRRRRRFYEQYFSSNACRSYYKNFIEVAQNAMKKWETETNGKQICLTASVNQYGLTALVRSMYGDIFDEQNMKRFLELNHYVFLNLVPNPPIHSEKYKLLTQKIDEMKVMVINAFEKRKKTKKDDEERLFIDVLLEEDLTDKQRLDDAFLIIAAGYQTSATHIAWTLYQLCKTPDVQEKLHHHIVSVLGNEPITPEAIPKLAYLRQVLDEGVRFFERNMFFARKIDEDLEIDGYTIPKNTIIYSTVTAIFQDPKYFPNPEQFNPDHFSPENIRSRHAFAWKPFGYAGKRACLGMSFAMYQASVYIGEWCRRFRFKLAPGQREDLELTASNIPEDEIWITVEKRNFN